MKEEKILLYVLIFLCSFVCVGQYRQRESYVSYINEISNGVVELRRQNDLLVELIDND